MTMTVGRLDGPVRFGATGRFVSGPGWRHMRRSIDDFELVFVRRGVLPVAVGGVSRDILAGQVSLWPPHVEHVGTRDIDEYLEYYWLHFSLDGCGILDDGASLPEDERCLVLPELFALADPDRLVVLLNQLLDLYVSHGPNPNVYCDYSATVALLEISAQVRAMAAGHVPEPAHNVGAIAADTFRKPGGGGSGDGAHGIAAMQAVRSWIQANAFEPLTVAGVAEHFHYSPSYLTASYRRAYGMGVVEQIAEYRIDRARDLLGSTLLPVSTVASQVGYADPKYFARVFKRRTGLTPTQYRASFPGKLFNSA